MALVFWRSLVACWLSVGLLRDYVCFWSVYHCSWAWGQIPVKQYVAWAHAQAMCLRCVCVALEALLAWRGVAWRSSSVAFLLILCKSFFPSKWFSLLLFLVVPVVVRPLLESSLFSFVMPRLSRSTNNSLSARFPTQVLWRVRLPVLGRLS